MLRPLKQSPTFSLSEARGIVGDLFVPKPGVYWTDFLLTWGVGLACFRLVREFPLFSPVQILLFVASALLFYRAAIFTHELVHRREENFRAFHIVWNLLCGIPFLMPSFTYYTHIDHHRRKHYGTKFDGEYLPLGARPPREILIYMLQPLFIPPLAVIRFGLLTPLTWISSRFRDFVHQHASSMIMNPAYLRPLPSKRILRIIRLQELCCFLFVWIAGAILAYRGWLVYVAIQAYCTGVFIITVNAIRTLAAHRYTNLEGEMTFLEQLLDSINFSDKSRMAFTWAPLGLKYHALHHLFPSLPYHAMHEAHKRLMRELPKDSPYREVEEDSLLRALADLWRSAANSMKRSDEVRPSKAA